MALQIKILPLPSLAKSFSFSASHLAIVLICVTVMLIGAGILLARIFQINLNGLLLIASGKMVANTALGFIFAGLGLLLNSHIGFDKPKFRVVKLLCVGSVSSLSALTLMEYLFDIDTGIDELIATGDPESVRFSPGRMSPITALNFALMGLILILQQYRPRSEQSLIELLAVVLLGNAGLALLGYVFSLQGLSHLSPYMSMALLTALLFALLALGILVEIAQSIRLALNYGLILIAVALVFKIYVAIEDWFDSSLPTFICFYPVIMLASLLAGVGPGLFALALSAMAIAIWIFEPVGFFKIDHAINQIAMLLFLTNGMVINLIVHLYHCTRDKVVAYEHAQAMAVAEEYEARLSFALESCQIGSWDLDLEKGVITRSLQHARIFGYSDASATWTLEDFLKQVHPDFQEVIANDIRARILARIGWTLEFPVIRADGEQRWIWVSGRYNTAPTGHGRVTGVVQDITERKLAEAASREREQRYELVVTGAEAAIWDWDILNKRVLYSPRWKQLRGLSDNEVSDNEDEWRQGIHPDDIERVMRSLQDHFDGKTPFFVEEYRIHHKDGRWLWILDRGLVRRDNSGKVIRMAGSETDITDRKLAEAALRESNERFRVSFANATIGFATNGPDFTYLDVNPAYCAMTGYTRQELLGMKVAELMHPDDMPANLALAEQMMAGEIADFNVENRYIRKDGECIWVRKSVSLVRSADGEPRWIITLVEDVSERKQAEIELRESLRNERERADELQTLLDTAPIGLAIAKDRQGLHIVGNKAHEIMYGLPAGAELSKRSPQASGYKVFQDGRELPVDELPMQRALKGVAVDGQIIEVQSHSGKNLTIFAKATPLYQNTGQPRGAVGAFLDISGLKQTETALQAAHDTFRHLVEQSPFGIYVVDADFRLALVSAGAQKVFENVRPLLGRDFAEVLLSIWPEAFAGEAIGHFRHTLATGETFHAPRTVEQRRDILQTESYDWKIERISLPDGRYGVVCHFYDLSERLRYESELRASEERFRAVFENAAIGIAIADLEGRFEQCNPAYCQLLGYSPEEFRWVTFSELIYPGDYAANMVEIHRLKDHKLPHFEIENRYVRKDGQIVWVRKFVSLLQGPDGKSAHLLALVTNMTERRRLEEALRDADRRKNEFLATLAHELRNPLSPVSNGLQILKMPDLDPEKVTHVYEMMTRQVNLMVRLVDELMEVSRITRGKIELQKEKVNLATVLNSAVETSRPLIDSAHHQLDIGLPAEPVILNADPLRLTQVIANLLNNAAKYTPENGRIWLSARREGTNALITVRDNGIGIRAEMLPIVFDLFTQADRTSHRAQGGLGIGLTLAHSLVALHGGHVEAKSKGLGLGSEFIVKLPLVENLSSPGNDDPDEIHMNLDISALRILVVDDNHDAADSLSLLLKGMGTNIRVAYDGKTALETLITFQPALVMLDIGMPEMDGYEVARQIRLLPEGHDLTLIALTGWGQEADRCKSKEAGFNHHLVKPVNLRVLKALLAASIHP